MRIEQSNLVAGFNVIELIVVILLLSFLAVTTLPRMLADDDAAHAAAFAGTVDGFQTGLELYHAHWLHNGGAQAGIALDSFAGLRATPQGYPHGLAARETHLPVLSRDCADILDQLLQRDGPTEVADSVAHAVGRNALYVAVQAGNDCHYYYLAQTSHSGATVPMFSYLTATGSLTTGEVKLP
ncbi:MAG: type II secretion system protein [Pseudomonadota bacterium]